MTPRQQLAAWMRKGRFNYPHLQEKPCRLIHFDDFDENGNPFAACAFGFALLGRGERLPPTRRLPRGSVWKDGGGILDLHRSTFVRGEDGHLYTVISAFDCHDWTVEQIATALEKEES